MLLLFAFVVVKSDESGLDMTHDCMPEVTQPIADSPPGATVLGTAVSTIAGWLIWTEHCAVSLFELFVQPREYVALLVPEGGVVMTVVVEPESWPLVVKPLPEEAVALSHEYEIVTAIPTSAEVGWHEICAVGCTVVVVVPPSELFGMHCQPYGQPLLCEVCFHVPLVQPEVGSLCGCGQAAPSLPVPYVAVCDEESAHDVPELAHPYEQYCTVCCWQELLDMYL